MSGRLFISKRRRIMGKYNIGDVWWTHFPFENSNIVINDDEIAILAMYVTSKDKETPYSIEITDWEQTGLSKVSWARIDRIISISEWNLDRKIGKLTERDLLKILQLVAEITTETFHEFSLAAIKNNNRFLQIYDNRWKCWLFPYFRSTQNNNKENIDLSISNLLKIQLSTKYIAQAKHCKYSVSDGVYKIYNHKLYMIRLDELPEYMDKDEFEIGDKVFKWLSIGEMEEDFDIMSKNDDVIAFVKKRCC